MEALLREFYRKVVSVSGHDLLLCRRHRSRRPKLSQGTLTSCLEGQGELASILEIPKSKMLSPFLTIVVSLPDPDPSSTRSQ